MTITVRQITLADLDEKEARRAMIDPDDTIADEIVRAIRNQNRKQVYEEAKAEYAKQAADAAVDNASLPVYTDEKAMNEWFLAQPAGQKTATMLHIERMRPNLQKAMEQQDQQLASLNDQKRQGGLTPSQANLVDAQIAQCHAAKADIQAKLNELVALAEKESARLEAPAA